MLFRIPFSFVLDLEDFSVYGQRNISICYSNEVTKLDLESDVIITQISATVAALCVEHHVSTPELFKQNWIKQTLVPSITHHI